MDYSRIHLKTPENHTTISMKSLDSSIGSEIDIFASSLYKKSLSESSLSIARIHLSEITTAPSCHPHLPTPRTSTSSGTREYARRVRFFRLEHLDLDFLFRPSEDPECERRRRPYPA